MKENGKVVLKAFTLSDLIRGLDVVEEPGFSSIAGRENRVRKTYEVDVYVEEEDPVMLALKLEKIRQGWSRSEVYVDLDVDDLDIKLLLSFVAMKVSPDGEENVLRLWVLHEDLDAELSLLE